VSKDEWSVNPVIIHSPDQFQARINELEAQLVQQAKLIGRALEVVQELVDSAERQDFYSFVTAIKLTATKAQALLPKLEAAIKEKP
jgi:hypothetical protein